MTQVLFVALLLLLIAWKIYSDVKWKAADIYFAKHCSTRPACCASRMACKHVDFCKLRNRNKERGFFHY